MVFEDRLIRPWLLFSKIFELTGAGLEEIKQKKRLDAFTKKMIDKRREIMISGEITSGRHCLLDYMIEIADENPDFTEEDIINETCTFMLAVSFSYELFR